MYTLKDEVVSGSTDFLSMKHVSNTGLWHVRLGHVSESGLVELEKQNLIGGDKVEKLEFYKRYVFFKSCRVMFNKDKQKTHGLLDYIHANIWGPARNHSHSGARYFISIVNDYSRNLWIFTQKTKDKNL